MTRTEDSQHPIIQWQNTERDRHFFRLWFRLASSFDQGRSLVKHHRGRSRERLDRPSIDPRHNRGHHCVAKEEDTNLRRKNSREPPHRDSLRGFIRTIPQRQKRKRNRFMLRKPRPSIQTLSQPRCPRTRRRQRLPGTNRGGRIRCLRSLVITRRRS